MAGIMHFSNFFRLMEETEHAFFRSLGISIHEEGNSQTIGWPRVNATCEYLHPLKFEEKVEIHLLVKEIRRTTITYYFQFSKVDGDRRVDVARGRITTICAQLNVKKGELESIAIPPKILENIDPAPPGLFQELG